MGVLSWPIARGPLGVVFPWTADSRERDTTWRWTLHVIVWAAALVALWYVNRAIGMDRYLRSPWPWLHRFWLPGMGALIYALGWGCHALGRHLRPEPPTIDWPDLDLTWLEASRQLTHARIDAARTPLFLILGPKSNELNDLLASMDAKPMTQGADAPFQVYAQRNAIFIVASKLHAPNGRRDDGASRLCDLCTLLQADRADAAGIQGIVLTAAFESVQEDASARAMIQACREAIDVVRDATKLETPIYFVVTGALPPGLATTPACLRFPPMPDLDPAEILIMFENAAHSACDKQLPQQLRRGLQFDGAESGDGSLTSTLLENIRLYHWWSAIHAWRSRLVELLVEGTQNEMGEPGMVAGCYFLSPDQPGQIAELLWRDLVTNRLVKSMTPGAATEHTREQRIAFAGYAAGLVVLAMLLVGLGLSGWWRS